MRTTLTIEDDLIAELKAAAMRNGLSLKEIVNRALRAGLGTLSNPPVKRRYRCKTYPMGQPSAMNLDKALALAAVLEDEEIVRKLALHPG